MLALLPWLLLHAEPTRPDSCPQFPLRRMQVLDERGRPIRDARLLDGEEPVSRTDKKGWMRVPEEVRVCHPVLTGDNRAHIDLSRKDSLKPDANAEQVFTLPEARKIDLHALVAGQPCSSVRVARASKPAEVIAQSNENMVQVELPLGESAVIVTCGMGPRAPGKKVTLTVKRESLQDLHVDIATGTVR